MSDILRFVTDHIFELVSVVGIVSAFLLSARQNAITARAIRAQSFVNLFDLEIQSGFQRGIRAIMSLDHCESFTEFETTQPDDTRETIYNAVVFLNFMAVLGEEGYLHIQDAWDVYFWSYRKCHEKLFPWWLEGIRASQPHVFPSFERACSVITEVTNDQIAAFDKRIGVKYLDMYSSTSRVDKGTLRKVLSLQLAPVKPA